MHTWAALFLLLGTAGAEELFYVIKVTPTLVYLDAGERAGVEVGDRFAILRPAEGSGFVQVAEVEVIRVYAAFCIAEIHSLAEDEHIALLQRALPAAVWVDRAWEMLAQEGRQEAPTSGGGLALYFLGGGEWDKGVDLQWRDNTLVGVREVNDASLGVRLAAGFRRHWRLNGTLRAAGELLGGEDVDVSQVALEVELHYLFGALWRFTPYLGAGAGISRLSWDGRGGSKDSTAKLGFSVLGGLDFPLGERWSLLAEGGYQRLMRFDDLIDASSVRTFVGLGKHF